MTRPRLVTIARVACGVAGLVMLGLTFTDQVALWEYNSRYDIFIAVIFGGMAVVATLALTGRQPVRADRVLLMLAGGAFLWWFYPGIETFDGVHWTAWAGVGSSVVALIASLYLNIRTSAAEARDDTLPPAGWYPDPGGSEQRRYWSGRAWTEGLR